MQNINPLLQKTINHFKTTSYHRMFAILDLDLKIVLIDNKAPIVMRLSGEIIGKHFLYDFDRTPKRAEFVKKNMAKCIKNKQVITFLSVFYDRQPGYEMLVYNYMPLINNESGELFGVMVEADVPKFPINFYALKNHLFSEEVLPKQKRTKNQLKLTLREQEIMFLLFHCDTTEEIASILSSVYARTITVAAIRKSIWRGLYTKFDVQNIFALKSAAVSAKLHDKVPTSLSNELIFRI